MWECVCVGGWEGAACRVTLIILSIKTVGLVGWNRRPTSIGDARLPVFLQAAVYAMPACLAAFSRQ